MAPAHGLYLKNIEYPAELLEPPSNLAQMQSNVNLSDEMSIVWKCQ